MTTTELKEKKQEVEQKIKNLLLDFAEECVINEFSVSVGTNTIITHYSLEPTYFDVDVKITINI